MLVAAFLYEDIICRHGIFRKLIVDGGPKNKGIVKALVELYRIYRIIASAYYPAVNSIVKRGHRPITDTLSKLTYNGIKP